MDAKRYKRGILIGGGSIFQGIREIRYAKTGN